MDEERITPYFKSNLKVKVSNYKIENFNLKYSLVKI